jgi:hypothetical protein
VQEQRRHYRKPVEYAVEFVVAGSSERVTGVCRDLSLGGLNVETATPAPFGANVVIHLALSGIGDKGIPGVVRWVKGNAMGVQFGLLGARETYAITEALAR